ncbi:MAG: Bug family tripartite tricarboxylate transporter substrate binding protein [Pseudomonadota bacterium]|jgi:tripartite-type tricarboxylate transporter receptor subunit TctC
MSPPPLPRIPPAAALAPRRAGIGGGVLVLLSLLATPLLAQPAWPAKPVRLVVPWAAGSGTDLWSRAFSVRLHEALGQPVVIDNRGGAGTVIGTEIAARAPADGYTLYVGGSVSMAISPAIYPKVSYDPVRDFTPVSLVSRFYNAVAVHPSLPVRSVRELIELSRKRPGELMMASAGNGSTSHLTGELFMAMTGVKWVHVPYKGGGQSVAGVVGGESHFTISPVVSTAPMARAGKLRLLAVTSAQRLPSLPDLPTVAESGVPGFEYGGWNGILVPAGVPAEIVARLHAATVRAASTPEFREVLETEGSQLVASTPEQFAAFIRAEVEQHRKLIRAAGIRP